MNPLTSHEDQTCPKGKKKSQIRAISTYTQTPVQRQFMYFSSLTTFVTDFFLYPSERDHTRPSFIGPHSVVNGGTALKPKGCWDKTSMFLLLSFYPHQGVPRVPTHFHRFFRISTAQLEALRLSTTRDQTKVPLKDC